jgi:hypothetical protein
MGGIIIILLIVVAFVGGIILAYYKRSGVSLAINTFETQLGLSTTEQFDTYNNHWEGAQQIYSVNAGKPIDLKDAELLAQYDWSRRAADGSQLYDAYYEGIVLDNATADLDMDVAFPVNAAATSNVRAGDSGIQNANNSMMVNAKFSLVDMLDFYPVMAESPWGELAGTQDWPKEPIMQKNY